MENIRVPPASNNSSDDTRDGLSLPVRREIYAACHAAGMKAVSQAGAGYPFDRMPPETEAARQYLSERSTLYETTKAESRRLLLDRYGIGGDQLDRIESEGDAEKSPVWDGLEDERGPIPALARRYRRAREDCYAR